jgi:small subunit ribosomal protein S3Ae
MADDNKKRAVVDKWKKKKAFKLIAPKQFGNQEFGETVAVKPEQMVGRTVKINLSILTNQIRNKNTEAILRISKVEGSNAQTDFAGFVLKAAFLRRLFRRRTSKIEVIETLTTKDKHKVRIKYVIVTFGKQEALKTKVIRKEFSEEVKKLAAESSTEKFLELSLNTKEFFAESLQKMRKIAPISATEIEKIKVLYK